MARQVGTTGGSWWRSLARFAKDVGTAMVLLVACVLAILVAGVLTRGRS